MTTVEIGNPSFTDVRLLLENITTKNYETTSTERTVDGHPMLAASGLIGSLCIKVSDVSAQLKFTHKLNDIHSPPPLITTAVELDNRGHVGIYIPEGSADAVNYVKGISYAMQTYLPQYLIDSFKKGAVLSEVSGSLELPNAHELLDFIYFTNNCY